MQLKIKLFDRGRPGRICSLGKVFDEELKVDFLITPN